MSLEQPPLRSAELLEQQMLAEMPRLRAFLTRLAARDADDLLQESMARALQYRDSYREGGSLGAWMSKIAFRVYLDHRERERREPAPLGDEIVSVGAEAEGDPVVESAEVESMLGRLGPIERDVLLRFHRDGQSISWIAEELGMPVGTVKSHLHRARRKLSMDGKARTKP